MWVVSRDMLDATADARNEGEKEDYGIERTPMQDTRGNDKDEKVSTFLQSVRHITRIHALNLVETQCGGSAMLKSAEYRCVRQTGNGGDEVRK